MVENTFIVYVKLPLQILKLQLMVNIVDHLDLLNFYGVSQLWTEYSTFDDEDMLIMTWLYNYLPKAATLEKRSHFVCFLVTLVNPESTAILCIQIGHFNYHIDNVNYLKRLRVLPFYRLFI